MRHKAIFNVHSNVISVLGESGARDKNDTPVVLDENKIAIEVARLQAEHDAQAYARARQDEYPDWSVQLEKIYDDGLTKWKTEMVDPIKAKYPKP